MSRLTRDGTAPKPSRETKFSGANSVQLTTSRIGNLSRLIDTLIAICDDHTKCIISCRAHTKYIFSRSATGNHNDSVDARYHSIDEALS